MKKIFWKLQNEKRNVNQERSPLGDFFFWNVVFPSAFCDSTLQNAHKIRDGNTDVVLQWGQMEVRWRPSLLPYCLCLIGLQEKTKIKHFLKRDFDPPLPVPTPLTSSWPFLDPPPHWFWPPVWRNNAQTEERKWVGVLESFTLRSSTALAAL